MKAAVLKDWGKLSVENVDTPTCGPNEAIVGVLYAGICGSDVHVYHHRHPTAQCPVIMGHEFVGRLLELPAGARPDLKVGDIVSAQPYLSCGLCDSCVRGRDNVCTSLKIFGIHTAGCFAERVKVPAKKLFKVPDSVPLRTAAMIEPLAVAVHDVNISDMQFGDTVFIIGGGPIGSLIGLVAKLNGAAKVVVSEINEGRGPFIESLGLTWVNPKRQDLAEEIKRLTAGKGFDIVFETSGTQAGTDLMTAAVKNAGTIVLVGVPSGKFPTDTGSLLAKESRIVGVRLHSHFNFGKAIAMIQNPVIAETLNRMMTLELPLGRVDEGLQLVTKGEHMKIVLKIGG